MTGAAPAAIEVDGLTKRYGGRAVVDGVSFRVAAGETFALLGPNGAGKTTTVEILEGYRRGDAGQVRVLGEDPSTAGREHRARVGLMLQGGGGIDPRMTAREVLALHGAFHRSPRPPGELLELVGLDGAAAGTRFGQLSGGERQRLSLALALVGRPALVALDEPTAGMDVAGRAATRELLGRLRGEGVTVLLTSHDLADVERLADRLAILDRGRLVAIGSPAELAAGGPAAVRFRLDRALAAADLADLAGRLGPVIDDGERRYRLDGATATPRVVAALATWCENRGLLLVELGTGTATLEERYLDLVGRDTPPGDVT
ncbi:MAG TPA: ABC transporter ATP-binding protein [Candidatus Limnocylindrales bacterium]|nr:ABC transporter ATP-binding protein [Candidatus Limnocylindrales bacterium]